jgi:sulfate adenylyltransferase
MTLSVELSRNALEDALNITTGLFWPLRGFLTSTECAAVIREMRLPSGEAWSIPVTLELDAAAWQRAKHASRIELRFQGENVGYMEVEDVFEVSLQTLCLGTFGTTDLAHPGVALEFSRGPLRVGGRTVITSAKLLHAALHPERLRECFRRKGWQTAVGFQTRNPIHRAHEYLQRIGLEICDGLFVNPLLGWRRAGEFSEQAILAAYTTMAERFFPRGRVHIEGLRTPMRYAGPKEAIFHAIIRRNAGCTHFIIGRDHAGVGNFFGKYAAHELAREVTARQDLGIELLLLHEPYYCRTCEQIVSERSCGHAEAMIPVSGTGIREAFADGRIPDQRFMRREIAEAIAALGPDMFTIESIPDETTDSNRRTLAALPNAAA